MSWLNKACAVCFVVAATTAQSSNDARIRRFETQLEGLRRTLHIPSMSAAIVKDRTLLWSKGFGEAGPDTNYRIASLTKTFASVLLMQLVEQGKLNLDDKMASFSPRFKERFGAAASVRADSFSALYLKVPRSHVSFILLANSDALSAPFRLGSGEVMQSPFAIAFVRTFAVEGIQRRALSDLEEAERRSQRLLADWLAERATKTK